MMKKLKISPWMLTVVFIILVLLLSLNLYSNYIAQKKCCHRTDSSFIHPTFQSNRESIEKYNC